ncbi:PEPxxWA-CTERM sorting domain-containing protein [Glacieibacterium sp.]|uniref:PEPxxWA-CTERM sorting domain-containing protein n=1 Tax=Glacieibacterium sp. TaxID=2860237 RepID=UPI003B007F2F
MVPAAKAVRHHLSPRHAVAKPMVAAAEALPCSPTFLTSASPDAGLGTTGLTNPGIAPFAGEAPASIVSFAPGGFGGGFPSGGGGGGGGGGGTNVANGGTPGGGGGVPGGGGGIPGGGGGIPGAGGGIPGGGGTITSPPPMSSNAPEPAAWAMMISGFGIIGGAMRYTRTARAAA